MSRTLTFRGGPFDGQAWQVSGSEEMPAVLTVEQDHNPRLNTRYQLHGNEYRTEPEFGQLGTKEAAK